MKSNRSLAISTTIQETKINNIIGLLEKEFPHSVISESSIPLTKTRNRVFPIDKTLLIMVLTAVQTDKSLKNSVDLYYMIHQQTKEQALKEMERQAKEGKEQDCLTEKRKVGRPKKHTTHLPKSVAKDISLNTAAYSKARARIPMRMAQDLFRASRIQDAQNVYSHWHGHKVFIGDGTYVQMQDSESIRKDYEVKHNGKPGEGYPQGLLETITERGTGQLYSFVLANRHVSELSLFYKMIDDLAQGSLLLLDDLYNCFEIISKCKRKGIELVIPAKRARRYEVVEVVAEGDEIIRIKTPKKRSKWLEENEKPNHLTLRRIQCKSPEGKDYVLLTTVLDKSIDKDEFQQLYLTRWDIEISIREIKTIMDINILRSKTPEMVLKELTVSLATYNLIRKIIYASIKDLPFSPEEDFIYKFYSLNKDIHVDKKGRVYSRWTTGRRRTQAVDT